MEQRIISYTKGITRSPGELIAEDGELLECINLKCEGGELKPLLWPEKAGFALNDGEELLYIHKGSGYKNYFVSSGNTVKAFRILSDGTRKDLGFSHTFMHVPKFDAIGNTVVMLDDGDIHYVLFKDNDYNYLGQQIPECPISFGLQGEFKCYSKNNGYIEVSLAEKIKVLEYVGDPTLDTEKIFNPFSDANRDSVTEQLLAKVNQFIQDNVRDKGRFLYPFFVRYAYRLYDGTLVNHSSPILMLPSTGNTPFVSIHNLEGVGTATEVTQINCDISTIISTLDYKPLIDSGDRHALSLWGDIVKSVDIFVSEPIYLYNQNGKFEKIENSNHADSCFYGKLTGGDSYKDFSELDDELKEYYQKWDFISVYAHMMNNEHKIPSWWLKTPNYSESDIFSRIKDCSNFYFVHSVNIEDLPDVRTKIEISDGYLNSLSSRELMTDEYLSHDAKKSKKTFSYNNRINIYNVSRKLFDGFRADSMFFYVNGYNTYSTSGKVWMDNYAGTKLYLRTKIDNNSGENIIVGTENSSEDMVFADSAKYIYYPNTNVDTFYVGASQYISSSVSYKAEKHKSLNGSFYFHGFGRTYASDESIPSESSNKEVEDSGKIYTSEVNNPFVFPASGVNTIGTGDIIGIVSTTKALSQGQFGQFPLLVLSTDGIWAMTVNDEGLYSTKQVLSRDVCNNADSIVQTDNLVFFSSERGLMAIDGANVVCVTEHMKGVPGTVQSLKRIEGILDKDEYKFVLLCDDGKEFKDFLKGCRIGYNYRDNTLYISNKEYAYLYVYDIRQGTFTKLCSADDSSKVIGFVNDYPDTLIQESVTIKSTDNKGEEVTTQKTNVYSMIADHDLSTTEPLYGFAMTRALKLGNPTGMKRIRQLKNLENVVDDDNYVKYALWGSNDGILWYNIRSYDGGFKYYRMGLFTKLAPSESVLGSVMAVEEKRNNKMR